ncbi:MAG: type II toxin-antitoxin system YafQ family toxin, partial [Acidovorax sp.]
CHVGGDFLLIYRLPDDASVIFARAGTHSELFGR